MKSKEYTDQLNEVLSCKGVTATSHELTSIAYELFVLCRTTIEEMAHMEEEIKQLQSYLKPTDEI